LLANSPKARKEKNWHLLAFSIIAPLAILKDFFTSSIVESKMFTESLTEKLLRQIG
jgi:hypothetical protein